MGEFGARLRELRLGQGLSLRKLEEATGVSNAYLSQIESGIRPRPSADILQKLAPVLGVSLRELLEAAGYLREEELTVSEEAEVDRAFAYVLADPRFRFGTRVRGELTIEARRFIVQMYEKLTGKRLL